MDDQALKGAKILEFCHNIGGAYCAKIMADMGAEVVKIEPPVMGDAARRRSPFPGDIPHPEKSGHFLFLNSNKMGITLNPEIPTGAKIFKELIKDVDILIEDNAPGKIEEMGLGYEDLKTLNPGLIMTSITPFGRNGPYKDYKAQHLNVSHVSGHGFMLPLPAYDDSRPPVMAGGNRGGYDAGMISVIGVLAAYFYKGVTGKGQFIEISDQEAMISLQRVESTVYANDGINLSRSVESQNKMVGGILECKDGHVAVLTPLEHQWQGLVKLMGKPEWTNAEICKGIENRLQNCFEINKKIADWMRHHTRDEIVQRGQQFNCPISSVNSAADIINSKQYASRNFFEEIEHPEIGKVKFPKAPYQFKETPWKLNRPAPLLGENNEMIFCERLGYTKEDLVNFRGTGII